MPAEAQSAQTPAVKTLFDAALEEQRSLETTLSPEEFDADRAVKWAKFNALCEKMSRQARASGLTEEILAEILAEE